MKARAVVFTHVHRPFTLYGLPARMVGVAFFGAMAVWMVCVASGLAGFAMMIAAVVMALELAGCYVVGKTDPHIESVLLLASRFWRTSSRRWLLAGVPAMRSRGGRP